MRKTIILTTAAVLTVVLGFLANASAAENSRIWVVQLKGKAVGETRSIPPIDATKTTGEGNCFEVDLTDVMTNRVIGTAMRCFTDVNTVGDGMTLTDTTFYRLREGTIVSRQRTVIQPALDSWPDVTHISMAIPAPFANTVLADAGSGAFKGVSGSTRLAGAMDMRQFRERNEIAFNDIALIQLADRQAVSVGKSSEPVGQQQARIRQAQKRLQEAGFSPGDVDGVLGPQTRMAIQQYQAKHGLPKTGDLDEATLRALKVS